MANHLCRGVVNEDGGESVKRRGRESRQSGDDHGGGESPCQVVPALYRQDGGDQRQYGKE